MVAVWMVALALPAWGAVSRDAQWNAAQLRSGLLRFQASLRSVRVTYRVPYDLAKDPSLRRGAYLHREIAARGPRSALVGQASIDDRFSLYAFAGEWFGTLCCFLTLGLLLLPGRNERCDTERRLADAQ